MDVFYYWKNLDADLRDGRVGWLKTSRTRLGEMHSRYPDDIWAFRTPPGHKGQLVLEARLRWTAAPSGAKNPEIDPAATIFYYPAKSVRFVHEPDTIDADLNVLLRTAFPSAYRANFQGDNGVQALDGDTLLRLKRIAAAYPSVPFESVLPPR